MTPQEVAAAESAMKQAEGMIAGFIPEGAQVGMATLIIQSADASPNQTVDGRFAAAKAALLAAAAASGHAGQLSDDMATDLVDAALNAVAALRPA